MATEDEDDPFAPPPLRCLECREDIPNGTGVTVDEYPFLGVKGQVGRVYCRNCYEQIKARGEAGN